jgi:glutamate--cysteine ligase
MSDAARALPAFTAYGVELEYMIVDRQQLDLRDYADRVLVDGAGRPVTDLAHGKIGWSNELMLHVLELKNIEPVATLAGLDADFHAEIGAVNARLAPLDAQLMPGGMHPWMDPRREGKLWPHENAQIYRSFDRIFDCHRHGWANMQSMHLNLPFAGAGEFARLHAAVRLALPILPALAASSPWVEGRPSGCMDYRMAIYRQHQKQVPASIGDCIPDSSPSPADYRERILAPMRREISRYDTLLGADAGVLTQDWVDVRAAVPRFARSAIEIRVLDVQECPAADLAIAGATAALVHRLYDDPDSGAALPTAALVDIFDACIRDAQRALITDGDYLARLGMPTRSCTAGDLWEGLLELLQRAGMLAPQWSPPLQTIIRRGTLAERISRALGGDAGRLPAVYREMCACLRDNRMFAA